MEKQNYYCSITAKISARDTFKCICKVTEWWSKNIEGKSKKLNDVFTYYSRESRVTFKITECIPDKKIVWYVTDSYLHWLSEKKEWTNTQIMYEISTKNNPTKIDFTHVGLVPEIECYERCEKGWTRFVTISLPKFLNEGKRLPE